MELIHPGAAYALLFLFALAIGSFLNVVIYRLPQMLDAEWKNECRSLLNLPPSIEPNLNLFLPRSFCPCCKTTISAFNNIPLLSYFLLKGRCKICKNPISLRYPLVECLSAVLALFAALHFGFNLHLVFALLFIWLLIPLFFIDLERQILPDTLTLGLLWVGLIANTQTLFCSLPNAVLTASAAYLSLWLFIKIYYLISGKIGMGNGDFKLFAAFGAWFGWTQLPLILLLASLIGAVLGTIYFKYRGKTIETAIPFGPFLCLSGLVSLLWGERFMNWYLSAWM